MFKIGDFSRLTRVSIRMLRHYDEIGLLKPQNIDKFTGYRFYSANQIPKINRILVLKEMGFSLLEICELLKKGFDSQQMLIFLQNRKREISSVIKNENEKLLRVDTLIKSINKEDSNMKYEVVLKDIPAHKVIALRDIIPAYDKEGALWHELQTYVEKNNIKCTSPCYTIYYDKGYKASDVDVEVAMCIIKDVPETDRIKVKELEAVPKMAVTIHQGPFEELTSAYRALAIWIESNGYEMQETSRAIQHRGPWNETNPENYMTEIHMPVTKK